MFILKAYRNAATFEQKFSNKNLYMEQAGVLQANGWTIGVMQTTSRLVS